MPRKIRELKADLRRAGFAVRPGKGSHSVWGHPLGRRIVSLAGADGDDAKAYQERDVREAIAEARRAEQQRRQP